MLTNKEAITILKDISWQMGSVKRWENIEAIDMAIEALNTDIVRCEECKKQFTNNCYMIYGKNMMRNLFDNDFCSYGERREDW